MSRFHPPRNWSWFWPRIWLLVAACAVLACWGHALQRAEHVRNDAAAAARRELAGHAEGFEQYLTRSVAQMDQVTMQLKHGWEQAGGRLRLEALYRDGMFTDPAFAAISIYDALGRPVSRAGRRPDGGRPTSFDYHRANNSSAMRIVVPAGTLWASQSSLQFTRRLEDDRDGFAGVLVLTLDARYLTSFYSRRLLGDKGVIAVVGDASALRLEQHGELVGLPAGGSVFSTAPDLGGAAGTAQFGAAAFYDQTERLLSWRHSSASATACSGSAA